MTDADDEGPGNVLIMPNTNWLLRRVTLDLEIWHGQPREKTFTMTAREVLEHKIVPGKYIRVKQGGIYWRGWVRSIEPGLGA